MQILFFFCKFEDYPTTGKTGTPQALIVIGHLHISDFDSKIMRFSGVIYLEGGQ
jgi:hypothetical protein